MIYPPHRPSPSFVGGVAVAGTALILGALAFWLLDSAERYLAEVPR